MKRKHILTILTIIIFMLITITAAVLIKTNVSENKSYTNENKKKEKIYKHTLPKQVVNENTFPGTFISNDIASIYPRRNAIVKDIFVDIGDKVNEGDTLALLFKSGVYGEGNSNINIKQTLLSNQKKILSNILDIKKAKIDEIDTKIHEKKVLINETNNNYNSKLNQIKNLIENKGDVENNSITNSLNELKLEKQKLQTLSTKLENAIISKENKIQNAKNNKEQKKELLKLKINEIYKNIIPIIHIGNEDNIDYNDITNDMSDYFSAKDTSLKNNLVINLKKYENEKISIVESYKLLKNINNMLIKALESTISSSKISKDKISEYIGKVNMYNAELTSSKESYDDSIQNYNILKANENEKIENLKSNIEDQKKVIDLKKSNYDLTYLSKNEKIENLKLELEKVKSEKKLKLDKLNAELQTIKNSKKLVEANENKKITSIQNEIDIAKSKLNNEYIKSGNYEIKSPFTGVISKRSINIGEKISLDTEAFRMSGVNNSLSKITKNEIKFYVPENLKENIKIGDEVTFFLSENNGKSYTGYIYRISPEIDEKTFTITVQAKIDDNINIPNKSTIKVIIKNKKSLFKIPTSSIYNKEDRKIVYYKKDNGKFGIKDVNVVSDDGEYSLVNGNFDKNLKVITTPIFIK